MMFIYILNVSYTLNLKVPLEIKNASLRISKVSFFEPEGETLYFSFSLASLQIFFKKSIISTLSNINSCKILIKL